MTLWSYHVTSRVTVCKHALQKSILIRAQLWLKKGLTTLKSVPLMLKRNAFGCIVFERRVGR